MPDTGARGSIGKKIVQVRAQHCERDSQAQSKRRAQAINPHSCLRGNYHCGERERYGAAKTCGCEDFQCTEELQDKKQRHQHDEPGARNPAVEMDEDEVYEQRNKERCCQMQMAEDLLAEYVRRETVNVTAQQRNPWLPHDVTAQNEGRPGGERG